MSAMSAAGRATINVPLAGRTGRSLGGINGNGVATPAALAQRRAHAGAHKLRAAARTRSSRPIRFATPGAMPIEANHSAIPERQVRHESRMKDRGWLE